MLNLAICPWVDDGLVAVVEPHPVRRFSIGTLYFEDFCLMFGLSHVAALEVDTVTSYSMHRYLP